LSEISIAYRNPVYIADQVFPIVNVEKQSDIYAVYTKADWFRDEAQRRTPGEEVKRVGYNVDTSNTYYAINYAIGKDIPDEVRAGADNVFDLDREASLYVTDQLQRRREIEWVADNFITGVWGNTKTGNSDFTYWDTYETSDPISDVHDGIEQVLNDTGRVPNTLVMGFQVFNELQDHPDFLDRIKYTQVGIVTEDLMARVFGVDRVLVARAIKTTTLEQGGTATMAFIWGKNALLLYVPPRPSRLEPAAGYTFVWNPMGGAGPQIINQRRDDAGHTDVVEALGWWDSKIVGSDLGYMMLTAVS